MKRIAESPEVSRWRLAERLGGTPPVRTPRYRKEQDEELLHHIRAIPDERQACGYRRFSRSSIRFRGPKVSIGEPQACLPDHVFLRIRIKGIAGGFSDEYQQHQQATKHCERR